MAKVLTVRIFLAISAARDWPMHQLDVNNSYLHGLIEEDLYMQPPDGYIEAKQGQVCKLIKSIYGLKCGIRNFL